MIYLHKNTKEKLLLKEKGNIVSFFYKLDKNQKKIPNFLSKKHKHPMRDVNGDICFELAICRNENVIEDLQVEDVKIKDFLPITLEDRRVYTCKIKDKVICYETTWLKGHITKKEFVKLALDTYICNS